ncbi:hypothetical protein [Pyruvatibacter sp.]|uniref:hypothetical protein n=1 Tax=Pyruvatibacter sp. TaxID=1981328 RepID=UPI0032EB787D
MDEVLTTCIKGHAPAMKADDIRTLAQLAGGMLINIATSATLIADAVPKSG